VSFDQGILWFAFVIGLLIVIASVSSIFGHFLSSRRVEDTPTSKIRSAAQGFVELSGLSSTSKKKAITAPWSGKSCAWYECLVKAARHKDPPTIKRWQSNEPLAIYDGTGHCLIDNDQMNVHWPNVGFKKKNCDNWFGDKKEFHASYEGRRYSHQNKYLFVEIRIPYNANIVASGWFESRNLKQDSLLEIEADKILNEWKKERASLLERFDTNGDGEIDLAEWKHAREVAQIEAQNRLSSPSQTELHLLTRAPVNDKPLEVYVGSEMEIAPYNRKEVAGWFVGLALGLFFTSATVYRLLEEYKIIGP
jgi:hypothetical protein